jgi:hypothetical protein
VLGGGQDGRRARGRRLPVSRPRLALTGLAAAATAAAIAVALATQGEGPERSATASPAVKELAYRVAAVAATRPDVRPGQWAYWQEALVFAPGKAAGPAGHETFQVWTTADSGKAAYLWKGEVVLSSPRPQDPRPGVCREEPPSSAPRSSPAPEYCPDRPPALR